MILRKLMTEPGTLKEFVDTYVAERRQLVADITKRRNRVEGEMAKAKAARSRMEDNLIWGNISREKFEEIKPDLDRRIALAEVDLARTAEPPKLDLHPEAVRAYKEVLDTLHAALASQATAKNEELMKSIRDLLKAVIVHPTLPDAPMHVELFGNLAALTGDAATIKVVAGAGFRRQDYANTEIKDISGSSRTAAAGVCPARLFIHLAWDIGPKAAAA